MSNRKRKNSPIVSYGIILFYRSKEDFYFLLQQRRDTFEYIDFMWGAWRNRRHLRTLFTVMSEVERERIGNYSFNELWEDLWIGKDCRIYRELYPIAKKKYDSIKHLLPTLLKDTTSYIKEPPWGFPKGKKNNENESEKDCALREMEEEVCISKEKVNILSNDKFSEYFQGTNSKSYITHYFIGEVKQMMKPNRISTPYIREFTVSDEVKNVIWVPYNEACKFLNPRRQIIINEVIEKIKSL